MVYPRLVWPTCELVGTMLVGFLRWRLVGFKARFLVAASFLGANSIRHSRSLSDPLSLSYLVGIGMRLKSSAFLVVFECLRY